MSNKLRTAVVTGLLMLTTIPLIPNANADKRTLEHTHESVLATNQDGRGFRIFPDWMSSENDRMTPVMRKLSKDTAIHAAKRELGKRRCKLLYAHQHKSGRLYVLQFSCNNVLTIVNVYSLYRSGENKEWMKAL